MDALGLRDCQEPPPLFTSPRSAFNNALFRQFLDSSESLPAEYSLDRLASSQTSAGTIALGTNFRLGFTRAFCPVLFVALPPGFVDAILKHSVRAGKRGVYTPQPDSEGIGCILAPDAMEDTRSDIS